MKNTSTINAETRRDTNRGTARPVEPRTSEYSINRSLGWCSLWHKSWTHHLRSRNGVTSREYARTRNDDRDSSTVGPRTILFPTPSLTLRRNKHVGPHTILDLWKENVLDPSATCFQRAQLAEFLLVLSNPTQFPGIPLSGLVNIKRAVACLENSRLASSR